MVDSLEAQDRGGQDPHRLTSFCSFFPTSLSLAFQRLLQRIPCTEQPGGLQSMGSQESDTTE